MLSVHLSFPICVTKLGRPNSNHKWKHFEGAPGNCQVTWAMTKQQGKERRFVAQKHRLSFWRMGQRDSV